MRKALRPQGDFAVRVDAQTAGKLMSGLANCGKFDELEELIAQLPNTAKYPKNEEITRAEISLAWHKKECEVVYKLIEEGKFSNAEDLIDVWDQAHYLAEENKIKGRKSLNALQRYRVRERFPPPKSICPSGHRKKRGIPRATTDALREWFEEHSEYPYPTTVDKLILTQEQGLTMCQLKNWFANARRRQRNNTSTCAKHAPSINQSENTVPSVNQSESTPLTPGEVQDTLVQSMNINPAPQVAWNSGCYNPQFNQFLEPWSLFPPFVAGGQYFPWCPEVMGFAQTPITAPGFPLVIFPRPSTQGSVCWNSVPHLHQSNSLKVPPIQADVGK